MIKFTVITIFPDQIKDFLNFGLTRIATSTEKVAFEVLDLRTFSTDKHKTVDDRPYGGGAGMVMKVEPLAKAIASAKETAQKEGYTDQKVIITTPTGQRLNQKLVKSMADEGAESNVNYIIICGHYEGIDYRVHENFADMEISVGDYVLSGGEIAALTIIDSITRLVPGVLGNEQSLDQESFENDALEYPQYTRPEDFNGWKVPEVLLSGNHAEIEKWRKGQSKGLTD